MAFMPRFTELSPLFHLLDDYETHRSRRPTRNDPRCTSSPPPSSAASYFTPAFDVRELNDSYHLDGELPGVHQSSIEIEFSDAQTLVIKGRAEREYSNSNQSSTGEDNSGASSPPRWRQPTVEDEDEDEKKKNAESSDTEMTETTQRVTKKQHAERPVPQPQPKTSAHYWVSERMVGDFQRTFTFPTRVDQDSVRASLKNGILSVVVPKEAAPRAKKIRVE